MPNILYFVLKVEAAYLPIVHIALQCSPGDGWYGDLL